MVLNVPEEASVALKLKKFASSADSIDGLHHAIEQDRLNATKHTADAIRKLKVSTAATKLC